MSGGSTPPAGEQPALRLDALGTMCPVPVIMLADRLADVPEGRLIEVLADDPAARTDVPAWCTLKAQEFAGSRQLPGGGWAFLVRRRS